MYLTLKIFNKKKKVLVVTTTLFTFFFILFLRKEGDNYSEPKEFKVSTFSTINIYVKPLSQNKSEKVEIEKERKEVVYVKRMAMAQGIV